MNAPDRWVFLTFGAGLPNWRAAAHRLGRQAKAVGWFDTTVVITDRDLGKLYPTFVSKHQQVLNSKTRGYGYWVWKSFLIHEIWQGLRGSHAGLLYLDGGCQLNNSSLESVKRWNFYKALAHDAGIFAMHLRDHPEEEWSRVIVMNRLGLTPQDRLSQQIQGGVVALTHGGAELVHRWHQISIEDDYALVKDAPPGEVNSVNFREHRHDQAIFSGLLKSERISTIPDETYWAPDWAMSGRNFPIWAARNRTRVSVESMDVRSRAIRTAEKTYSRIHSSMMSRLHAP